MSLLLSCHNLYCINQTSLLAFQTYEIDSLMLFFSPRPRLGAPLSGYPEGDLNKFLKFDR